MADTEENGMLALSGVGVVVALSKKRGALIRGHRGVSVVIAVWHVVIAFALNLSCLAEARLVEMIVIVTR